MQNVAVLASAAGRYRWRAAVKTTHWQCEKVAPDLTLPDAPLKAKSDVARA